MEAHGEWVIQLARGGWWLCDGPWWKFFGEWHGSLLHGPEIWGRKVADLVLIHIILNRKFKGTMVALLFLVQHSVLGIDDGAKVPQRCLHFMRQLSCQAQVTHCTFPHLLTAEADMVALLALATVSVAGFLTRHCPNMGPSRACFFLPPCRTDKSIILGMIRNVARCDRRGQVSIGFPYRNLVWPSTAHVHRTLFSLHYSSAKFMCGKEVDVMTTLLQKCIWSWLLILCDALYC